MHNLITITGKIGSGKSTCATLLARLLEYEYISADKVGHEILNSEDIACAIFDEFGEGVFHDGKVNRKALGDIVFADKSKLQWLTDLTSPAISKELDKRIESLLASNKGVIVEIPFIREGMTYYGLSIEVRTATDTRLNRIMDTRGLTEEKARNAIASQNGKVNADRVVHNNEHLGKTVRDLVFACGNEM